MVRLWVHATRFRPQFNSIGSFSGNTTSGVARTKFLLGEIFDFRWATVFCLGRCSSKHKTTRYAKMFWENDPLGTLCYAYEHYWWTTSKANWKDNNISKLPHHMQCTVLFRVDLHFDILCKSFPRFGHIPYYSPRVTALIVQAAVEHNSAGTF